MRDPRLRLRDAVISGNTSIVERLLRRFPQYLMNIDSFNGWLLLHYSGYYGHYVICAHLVTLGHELSLTFNGDTPTHTTAQSKNHQTLLLILQHFPESINIKGHKMRTPLHISIIENFVNGITLLISMGANVNVVDIDGNTPLHLALMYNVDSEIIRSLVFSNAQQDIRNSDGWFPIEVAYNSNTVESYLEIKSEWDAQCKQSLFNTNDEKNRSRSTTKNSVITNSSSSSSVTHNLDSLVQLSTPTLKISEKKQISKLSVRSMDSPLLITDPALVNRTLTPPITPTNTFTLSTRNSEEVTFHPPSIPAGTSSNSSGIGKSPNIGSPSSSLEDFSSPRSMNYESGAGSPIRPVEFKLTKPQQAKQKSGSSSTLLSNEVIAAFSPGGVPLSTSSSSPIKSSTYNMTVRQSRSNSNDLLKSGQQQSRIHSNSVGSGLSRFSSEKLRGVKSSSSLTEAEAKIIAQNQNQLGSSRPRAGSVQNMINTPGRFRSNTTLSYSSVPIAFSSTKSGTAALTTSPSTQTQTNNKNTSAQTSENMCTVISDSVNTSVSNITSPALGSNQISGSSYKQNISKIDFLLNNSKGDLLERDGRLKLNNSFDYECNDLNDSDEAGDNPDISFGAILDCTDSEHDEDSGTDLNSSDEDDLLNSPDMALISKNETKNVDLKDLSASDINGSKDSTLNAINLKQASVSMVNSKKASPTGEITSSLIFKSNSGNSFSSTGSFNTDTGNSSRASIKLHEPLLEEPLESVSPSGSSTTVAHSRTKRGMSSSEVTTSSGYHQLGNQSVRVRAMSEVQPVNNNRSITVNTLNNAPVTTNDNVGSNRARRSYDIGSYRRGPTRIQVSGSVLQSQSQAQSQDQGAQSQQRTFGTSRSQDSSQKLSQRLSRSLTVSQGYASMYSQVYASQQMQPIQQSHSSKAEGVASQSKLVKDQSYVDVQGRNRAQSQSQLHSTIKNQPVVYAQNYNQSIVQTGASQIPMQKNKIHLRAAHSVSHKANEQFSGTIQQVPQQFIIQGKFSESSDKQHIQSQGQPLLKQEPVPYMFQNKTQGNLQSQSHKPSQIQSHYKQLNQTLNQEQIQGQFLAQPISRNRSQSQPQSNLQQGKKANQEKTIQKPVSLTEAEKLKGISTPPLNSGAFENKSSSSSSCSTPKSSVTSPSIESQPLKPKYYSILSVPIVGRARK